MNCRFKISSKQFYLLPSVTESLKIERFRLAFTANVESRLRFLEINNKHTRIVD